MLGCCCPASSRPSATVFQGPPTRSGLRRIRSCDFHSGTRRGCRGWPDDAGQRATRHGLASMQRRRPRRIGCLWATQFSRRRLRRQSKSSHSLRKASLPEPVPDEAVETRNRNFWLSEGFVSGTCRFAADFWTRVQEAAGMASRGGVDWSWEEGEPVGQDYTCLDDDRDPLPSDAGRRHPIAPLPPTKLMQDGEDQPRPRGRQRMPQRDRPRSRCLGCDPTPGPSPRPDTAPRTPRLPRRDQCP